MTAPTYDRGGFSRPPTMFSEAVAYRAAQADRAFDQETMEENKFRAQRREERYAADISAAVSRAQAEGRIVSALDVYRNPGSVGHTRAEFTALAWATSERDERTAERKRARAFALNEGEGVTWADSSADTERANTAARVASADLCATIDAGLAPARTLRTIRREANRAAWNATEVLAEIIDTDASAQQWR